MPRSIEVQTYDLAVQVVLLHHDSVDALWVLEGEETETARAPACAVAHDRAFYDFAKLGEIVLE